MKIKQLHSKPKSGQWVELWEYNGLICSDMFKIVDGITLQYYSEYDEWDAPFGRPSKPITYIVLDRDK